MSDKLNVEKIKAFNTLTSKEPTCITDGEQINSYVDRDGNTKTAKSAVSFIPYRDKVLIQTTFKTRGGIVKDANKLRQDLENVESTIVVGVGEEVYGINIGDHVQVGYNSNIEQVLIPGNTKTIKHMLDLQQLHSDAINLVEHPNTFIYMIEYFIVPVFGIQGIHITE
jgi:hypothetical protein